MVWNGVDLGPLAVAAGVAFVLVMTTVVVARRLLLICAPNEILIFSGRKQRTSDGSGRRRGSICRRW